MKHILPFLVLVSIYGLELKSNLRLEFDLDIPEIKDEDDLTEDTLDSIDEMYDGISTSLGDGDEYTAEVPEEFQDDEDLVAETEDVDELLDSYEGSSIKDEDDFYEGIDEVEDIVDELDGDEYVILRDYEFNNRELEVAITDANELHESSMMSEAIDDLEAAFAGTLSEDLTLEELEVALAAIEQLLDYMEEDEAVLIFEKAFTYEDVVDLQTELLEAYEELDE